MLTTRQKLGIASGLTLLAALVMFFWNHYDPGNFLTAGMGATVRIGSVTFFLWLAWPELSKFPLWLYKALIPISVLIAIQPKLLLVIVPAVFLILYLRPNK